MSATAAEMITLLVLFLLAFLGVLISLFLLRRDQKRHRGTMAAMDARLRLKEEAFHEMEAKCEALSRFEAIVDSEAEAKALREATQRDVDALRSRAIIEKAEAVAKAQKQAAAILREANETLSQLRLETSALQEKADSILRGANAEAGKIVENAYAQARIIAGDAYKAMKSAVESLGSPGRTSDT